MAATLDQIIASLDSVYQPQIKSVQDQQAALPAQYDAQAQGLTAQKDAAFGDILNGARSRGLGFAGIPLADQAKYTATSYLPALANLKTAQTQQQTSLTDALNKIYADRYNQGQSIYQYNSTLDEQKRQFDAQQKAAASAASAFSPTYGGAAIGAAPAPAPGTPTTQANLTGSKSQQDAYNAVKSLLLTNNQKTIQQTVNSIAASAHNGNSYDQYKLQLLTTPALAQFYNGFNKIAIPAYNSNANVVAAGKF